MRGRRVPDHEPEEGYVYVGVFYSYPDLTDDGLFNEFKIEQMPVASSLEWMQGVLGGYLELAPRGRRGAKDVDADLAAYVNENGLMEGLRRNDLAGGSMFELGFPTLSLPLGCAYAGSVILTRIDGKSLTSSQMESIHGAIEAYESIYDDDSNSGS
jgi:hypothetical protein